MDLAKITFPSVAHPGQTVELIVQADCTFTCTEAEAGFAFQCALERYRPSPAEGPLGTQLVRDFAALTGGQVEWLRQPEPADTPLEKRRIH